MPLSYTRNELIDMLIIFGKADEDPYEAARLHRNNYPNRRHPEHRTFTKLLERTRETGTVDYKKPVHENPPACNDDNENQVMLHIIENPHVSTREIANLVGISHSSVWRIIKKNKFHPFKMILHQELTENDFLLRINFAQWGLQQIRQNRNFFNNVLFSDEASFRNDAVVVRHNMHYYENVNPHWTRERRCQHRWSLNVWCGIIGQHIVGPIFINRLNGENYLNLLENEIQNHLNELPQNIRNNLWWQQDGAPAHYALPVREFLNNRYENRWIGRGGPVGWPPRSPDMTPLDFFLWGYVKSQVYIVEPTTIENMQERIRTCINEISPEIILRSIGSIGRRFNLCIEKEGKHFEHFL